MDAAILTAMAIGLGYLLGSIPFGLLLTRLGGGGDLRAIGSGNIGATNVLRTGNKGLAALTLLLDMAKGTAAVLLGAQLLDGAHGAAIGALAGHIWPIWLRFRGGKGVATLFGIVVGFDVVQPADLPLASLGYAAIWLAVLALTRFSSVAGMTAALSAPVIAAVAGQFDIALLYLGFALLVFWMHRGNLDRLLSGEEPKVGRGGDG